MLINAFVIFIITVAAIVLLRIQWQLQATIVGYSSQGYEIRFSGSGGPVLRKVKGLYNTEGKRYIVPHGFCAQDLGILALRWDPWTSTNDHWDRFRDSVLNKTIYTHLSLWDIIKGFEVLPVIYRTQQQQQQITITTG
jgi:hypothetical protein